MGLVLGCDGWQKLDDAVGMRVWSAVREILRSWSRQAFTEIGGHDRYEGCHGSKDDLSGTESQSSRFFCKVEVVRCMFQYFAA